MNPTMIIDPIPPKKLTPAAKKRAAVAKKKAQVAAKKRKRKAEVQAAASATVNLPVHILQVSCPVEMASHSSFEVWDMSERHCFEVARPSTQSGEVTIMMKRAGNYLVKWIHNRIEEERAEMTTEAENISI
jgi:hypothetical protein